MLNDFCDGEFIKNHPLVTKNPETLILAFYFADLETANPLGSRRGKHKLGELFEVNLPCYSWHFLYFDIPLISLLMGVSICAMFMNVIVVSSEHSSCPLFNPPLYTASSCGKVE